MLEFKIIKHPDQLLEKIKSFDPQTTTWIVSDLKSKQDLQEICLEKNGYYIDDSILRISDFWKMWLRRLAPQIQIVSDDFILALVSQFIAKFGTDLGLHKNDQQTLFQYMSDLATLILHKPSQESLREWILEKQPTPRWAQWEIKAQACVNYIIHEHHCLSSNWMVSFIQTLDLQKIKWPKKIIVDLGAQMTSLEMGVLNTLSKSQTIEIIVPDPDWKHKFKYLLRTYTDYIGYVKYKNVQLSKYTQSIHEKNFFRFESEINEIKFITYQIRQWLDHGIELDKMCILSPRLESYWPILKIHFDAEGIKTQKETVSKAISLGIVQKLLSFIEAQTADVRWENLENAYTVLIDNDSFLAKFDNRELINKFHKFKAQFIELVDSEDLTKSEDIKKIFFQKINLSEILTRNDFLRRLLVYWYEVDPQLQFDTILQTVIKDFVQNSALVHLSFIDWYDLLKLRLSQIEIKTGNGFDKGLSVLPLNSSRVIGYTHKIWFGLDESGLLGRQNKSIPTEDIAELKQTFDLAFDYPEESISDFNLRWYSMSQCEVQIFTSANISAKAEILNISQFFIEHCKKPISVDALTVLDSEQQYFDLTQNNKLQFKLELESRELSIPISDVVIKSISPSDLETYSKCSFKFLVRKGFKLQNLDPEGYEIENRQKGNLIHGLFQYLVKDKKYLSFTDAEILDYLEQFRLQNRLFVNLDYFWTSQKKRFFKLAKEFAAFEKERLASLTTIEHYVEHPVEIYFDLAKSELTNEQPQNKYYLIRGRFDRMDVDRKSKSAIIFDYKSNKSDSTTYSNKWIETSQFQLLLYTALVEKIFNFKVIGGLYYFYKNFKHNYGYLLPNVSYELEQTLITQKNTLVNSDEFLELLADFKNKIVDIFNNIDQKKYSVSPSDNKNCNQCEAIRICRIQNRM